MKRLINNKPQAPFSYVLHSGKLCLTAPYYSLVSIKKLWGWSAVHDGRAWGEQGITAQKETILLSFPVNAHIRVSVQNNTWNIKITAPPRTRLRVPFKWRIQQSKFFGSSILLHLTMALFLMGIVRVRTFFGSKNIKQHVEIETITKNTQEPTPTSEVIATRVAVPFSGISYSRFQSSLIQKTGNLTERLSDLIGNVSAIDIKTTQKNRGNINEKLGVSDSLVKEGAGTGNSGLTGSMQGRRFAVMQATTKGSSPATLSEKDQALLREKFNSVQEDMKRAYSQALMTDPSLSVTVAFEVTVQPSGHLTLSSFKPRGIYQKQGLDKLRMGMEQIFQSLQVGKQFSGILVRGENIFVH